MSTPVIGLIAHAGKAGAGDLVKRVCEEFSRHSIAPLVEQETAALIGRESSWSVANLGENADLLVVLGGDGTILRVVHGLGARIKPVFGINLGSLGFLTCLGTADVTRAVACVVASSYDISHRSLLAVEVEHADREKASRIALNDVVISRGAVSRLIKLETRIDGAVLTEYNADGLIVATPTGSTAYSLAAGGPILAPNCGVFVVTPICPHVLTNRSVIVNDDSVIEVRPCDRDQEVFVTIDGQEIIEIRATDVVRIRKADFQLPLATLPEQPFFGILRQKLKWTGSNV